MEYSGKVDMLLFICVKCRSKILVKHLEIGEQALCQACGTRQSVPDNSEQLSEVPEDFQMPHNPQEVDIAIGEEISELDPDLNMVDSVKSHIRDKGGSRAKSWGNLLWLIFSIVIFMGVASYNWAYESILIIVAVILVHEMGHVLGMKVFGYKNIRMLFIPMLGAIVSGSQTGSKPYAPAVVALLGPIPGIVIGAVIALIAIMNQSPLMMEYATASLFINTFNLLPVMPLDGGRVLLGSSGVLGTSCLGALGQSYSTYLQR